MYCGVHAGSLTGAKEEPQAEGPGKWALLYRESRIPPGSGGRVL